MGLADLFSDLYDALAITEVHAEAPAADGDDGKADQGEQDDGDDSTDDKDDGEAGEGEAGGDEEGGDEGGDEEGGDDDEEEEEEEEEPEDPKPKLEEECANSAQCAPSKHHYDECVERVTEYQSKEKGGPKEDCVEEFFHLAHCATQCAAPKLFAQLK
ncbi:MAG: ubiquinol--cytochrome-c reductase subunit 6 [Caeruleum heppii]|nr:MAG: ubiquinol--cytochrome-c reductase subunit 6 [Caeruleum heppii]